MIARQLQHPAEIGEMKSFGGRRADAVGGVGGPPEMIGSVRQTLLGLRELTENCLDVAGQPVVTDGRQERNGLLARRPDDGHVTRGEA